MWGEILVTCLIEPAVKEQHGKKILDLRTGWIV